VERATWRINLDKSRFRDRERHCELVVDTRARVFVGV